MVENLASFIGYVVERLFLDMGYSPAPDPWEPDINRGPVPGLGTSAVVNIEVFTMAGYPKPQWEASISYEARGQY